MFSDILRGKFIDSVTRYCNGIVFGYSNLFIDKPEMGKSYEEIVRLALDAAGYDIIFINELIRKIKEYIKDTSHGLQNRPIDVILKEAFDVYETEYLKELQEESNM